MKSNCVSEQLLLREIILDTENVAIPNRETASEKTKYSAVSVFFSAISIKWS